MYVLNVEKQRQESYGALGGMLAACQALSSGL